jgi:hypothetical protein
MNPAQFAHLIHDPVSVDAMLSLLRRPDFQEAIRSFALTQWPIYVPIAVVAAILLGTLVNLYISARIRRDLRAQAARLDHLKEEIQAQLASQAHLVHPRPNFRSENLRRFEDA